MKAALGLTLVVAGVYLLTASGHIDGQDQEYYFRMACSLGREHTFAIDPLVYRNVEIAGARGRDGRFYAQYAPALPILLSPLVILADRISNSMPTVTSRYEWLNRGGADVSARVVVSYFDVVIVALSVGLLVLLVVEVGYSAFAAVFVSATFAFTTFAWGQSRIINPEPLQTLLILLAALLILRGSNKNDVLAGCALGLAVLVKITSVLALPGLLLLPERNDLPLWRRPLAASILLLPVIAAFALYACYNFARFGSILATGYPDAAALPELPSVQSGNPFTGLYGLLFSTGRGLIWYAPPILAAALGFPQLLRKRRQVAIGLAVLVATWVLAHACYTGWDSGWGWGPRYLLPILPLMLLPTAEAVKYRLGRIICVTLAVIGFFIQIPGASIDFMESGRAGTVLFGETASERSAAAFVSWRNFHIEGSEIVRHFALLKEGKIDVAWATFRHSSLSQITFCLVIILILSGALLIVSALRAQKRLERSPTKE